MNIFLVFLAALALAFSPVAASAGAVGCGIDRGDQAAMAGMVSPASKSADPCCPKDKACATACALVCQAVGALPSFVSTSPVMLGSVRFTPAVALSPHTADDRKDTPPPRTTA